MSCAATADFVFWQGKTFRRVARWESKPYIYKAITGITKAGGAVVTATSHGIPDGWRVAVVSVQGMTEINASAATPRESDYTKATVLTSNTVELNEINSFEFTTYTSGGYLQFYTPVDLAGYIARFTVKDKVGGTSLLALTSSSGIALNNTAKTITITVTATQTAAMTWVSGVYELEMESPTGEITGLLEGSIEVKREVAS